MTPDKEIQMLLSSDFGRGFDALFAKFYKPLVVYAFRMTGTLDAAEDIVQDVFYNLLDGRRYELVAEGKLSSYLFSAVRNRALNSLAHARRESLGADLRNVSQEEFPQMLFDDDIVERIREQVGRLSQRTRDIISDIVLGGRSYREVAERYGISINTVKTLLRRGMGRLRKELEAHAPHEAENI